MVKRYEHGDPIPGQWLDDGVNGLSDSGSWMLDTLLRLTFRALAIFAFMIALFTVIVFILVQL